MAWADMGGWLDGSDLYWIVPGALQEPGEIAEAVRTRVRELAAFMGP